MPYLNIATEDFPRSIQEVSKFVTQFLKRRRRGSKIDVSSVKLRFRTGKVGQPLFVKKLMDYAFSHNIQQLDVACLPEKHIEEFPLSLFSSQSLKYLSLKAESHQRYFFRTISTLELAALTTLYLQDVLCSNGIFSKCPSLKNLTLNSCQTEGWSSFSICHPGLSNLTLDAVEYATLVNVVAPHLQNLIIRNNTISSNNTIWPREYVISAPNLASLAYKGDYPLLLSTDGLHCLKEADICVCVPHTHDTTEAAHQMVCMLQQL